MLSTKTNHTPSCYRSALTVYEESLIHGHFVERAWYGAGYVNHPGCNCRKSG